MATAVLLDGGIQSLTNIANGTSTTYYFSFANKLNPGAHGASLIVDTITGGTATLSFSNDDLADGGGAAAQDDYLGTTTQLGNMTWIDLTASYSSSVPSSTVSTVQAINLNTNISYRYMRIVFTSTNATNSFRIQFRRQ